MISSFRVDFHTNFICKFKLIEICFLFPCFRISANSIKSFLDRFFFFPLSPIRIALRRILFFFLSPSCTSQKVILPQKIVARNLKRFLMNCRKAFIAGCSKWFWASQRLWFWPAHWILAAKKKGREKIAIIIFHGADAPSQRSDARSSGLWGNLRMGRNGQLIRLEGLRSPPPLWRYSRPNCAPREHINWFPLPPLHDLPQGWVMVEPGKCFFN